MDQEISKSVITQWFLESLYRKVLVFWCFKNARCMEFCLSKIFQYKAIAAPNKAWTLRCSLGGNQTLNTSTTSTLILSCKGSFSRADMLLAYSEQRQHWAAIPICFATRLKTDHLLTGAGSTHVWLVAACLFATHTCLLQITPTHVMEYFRVDQTQREQSK